MKAKIAFVLRLVDDFNGKTIQKTPFVFTQNDQILKPIVKEEGLYVFLEPQDEEVKISIQCTNYYNTNVTVMKRSLDPKEPIADVRLSAIPGKLNHYSYGLLTGRVDMGEFVSPVPICAMKSVDTGFQLKEIKMIEQDTYIQLSGFSKENLIGKTYSVGKGKTTEVFVVQSKVSMNEYLLSKPFTYKHNSGEKIYRAYRSVTDSQGGYAIPVDPGEEQLISEVIILQHK